MHVSSYIYLALGIDPEGDICFSIYQNNEMKMSSIFKKTIQCKSVEYSCTSCTRFKIFL